MFYLLTYIIKCNNKHVNRVVLLIIAKAKPSAVKSSTAKKNSTTVPKVTTVAQLTAKRGTLKRRRQLLQLIDHQRQQLDTADLFTSTPYQSHKLTMVSFLSLYFLTGVCFAEVFVSHIQLPDYLLWFSLYKVAQRVIWGDVLIPKTD